MPYNIQVMYQNCTLETYIVLLANVISVNLILKKRSHLDYQKKLMKSKWHTSVFSEPKSGVNLRSITFLWTIIQMRSYGCCILILVNDFLGPLLRNPDSYLKLEFM